MWTVPIALGTGNCVILKPSEKVPLTMARVCELMLEAGVPPGVFQTVRIERVLFWGVISIPLSFFYSFKTGTFASTMFYNENVCQTQIK